MIRYLADTPLRCAVWLKHGRPRLSPPPRDDRGAITTEAVIITAILAVVAAGFAFWLSQEVIPGWAGDVPESGEDPGFTPSD